MVIAREEVTKEADQIVKAAQNLFDNRLGWGENRNPYAPPQNSGLTWEQLCMGNMMRE